MKYQITFFALLAVLCLARPAQANMEFPPAVPAPSVQGESLDVPEPSVTEQKPELQREAPIEQVVPQKEPPKNDVVETPSIGSAPVIVELFSSQACVFCPKADQFLGELAQQENLIALDCHVDYFDVKLGALSIPFCSSRQASYETVLRAGPKYTPQMVINGRYDVVGYRKADVLRALEKAAQDKLQTVQILKSGSGELFDAVFADLPLSSEAALQELKIWLLVYDTPHHIKVAEGGNGGKEMTYTNIVSSAGYLGVWNGKAKHLRFDAKLREDSKGFAILAQDQTTGEIFAAGQYKIP